MANVAVVRRLAGIDADVADAALAAALLGLVGVQTAVGDGGGLAYLAFAPLITLPLVWRRRAPVAVAVVGAAALAAQALVTHPAVTFGEFLAMLVAAYSLGVYAAGGAAVAGAVVVAAAVGVHGHEEIASSYFEWIYAVVYFGGAFALGRVVRRRAAAVARTATAAERARLARELHDVVSHSVGVMVVQAGAARFALETEPERAREAIEDVERTGREALAELRRLLGLLRAGEPEAARAPQPTLDSIGGLVDSVRAAGVGLDLQLEGERRRLPEGIELAAYRIVQEALTNVLRHSRATHAVVRVRFAGESLQLEVTDDGVGCPAANGSGHGLAGMRERAALYGGTLDAGSREGGGFAVRASLPIGMTP